MYKSRSKKDRGVLRGWIKWVPVLAIPFSILFFHAWINIQILRADYVLRELNAESRKWADRLESTDIAKTFHEDPEVLAERASLLEFVQPTPGQREIIYYDPASVPPHPEDTHFEMARHDAPALATPAANESRGAQSALAVIGAPFASAPGVAPPSPAPDPSPVSEPAPAAAAQAAVATASPAADVALVTTPVVLPLAGAASANVETIAAPAAAPVVLDLPPDTRGINLLDEGMGGLDSL